MFFLILSILCSSMISIVMRASEGRISGKISMLAANYLTCMVIGAAYTGWDNLIPRGSGEGLTWGLGIVNGAFYMISLVLTQVSIQKNGVLLSNIFAKLGGLLVPLAVAIGIFGERPGMTQAAGAALAVVSIVAINYDPQGKLQGHTAFSGTILMLLLLAEGGASAMTKLFEELGAAEFSGHFLLFTFTAAFLFCLMVIWRRKERPGPAELMFGVMIGIPNFFASRFLLKALEDISAVIVYPTRSVANIVIVSLVGVCVFGEHLKKRQWAAVAVILAALVLLNL